MHSTALGENFFMAFCECFTNITKAYPDEDRDLSFFLFKGSKIWPLGYCSLESRKRIVFRGRPSMCWELVWSLALGSLGLHSIQHQYLVTMIWGKLFILLELQMFGKCCEEFGPILTIYGFCICGFPQTQIENIFKKIFVSVLNMYRLCYF